MQDTFDRKFLNRRTLLIPVLLGIMVILYVAVMHSVQIVHGSEYRARSISSNATTETVGASRGLITDRNGKVLVSNALAYTLTFSRQGFDGDSDLKPVQGETGTLTLGVPLQITPLLVPSPMNRIGADTLRRYDLLIERRAVAFRPFVAPSAVAWNSSVLRNEDWT